MNEFDIQRVLKKLGHYNGIVDGIMGRSSINAIKDFQKSQKLRRTGILDGATIRLLKEEHENPSSSRATSSYSSFLTKNSGNEIIGLPWMEEANRLKGTREIRGRRSNNVIMNWAKNLRISYSNDDVPWCGLFVAHCIAHVLPREKIPTNPLWARNWASFGYSTDLETIGAVMVFKRGKGGHVGFNVGWNRSYFYILGGNQSNTVNVMQIARNRTLAARWPSTALGLLKEYSPGKYAVAGTHLRKSRNEA